MSEPKKTFTVPVRTRIAPSPTGLPHVGSAFQALFDWVYARRYGGQFVVRIEDTDRTRFVEGSEEVIHDAMDWLQLVPDESSRYGGPYEPYRQSERLDVYKKYADQLVEQGNAYHCFCSSERLADMRTAQQAAGKPPKYDRTCRSLSSEVVAAKHAAGEKSVVRLKIPDNQIIIVHDELRGEIRFDSNEVDDQVLLKSDGFPTYHLAVVIDDHLMQISHMLRGEEWLPSAPKQVVLYQMLGWDLPVMIHTPTLRNPDKSKLSKRKGHTSIWWFRAQGFLRVPLLHFLALLAWKPADNREEFSLDDMIAEFEWEQMQVTGPVFDTVKLSWMNGKYIRSLSPDVLVTEITSWAEWTATQTFEPAEQALAQQVKTWLTQKPELFGKAVALAQERLRSLAELPDLLRFFFDEKLEYDRDDLLQKHTPAEVKNGLQVITTKLQALDPWEAATWEALVRQTADELSWKQKDLFMILRSAITAKKATPPLFEVMQVLGRRVCFARLEAALQAVSAW